MVKLCSQSKRQVKAFMNSVKRLNLCTSVYKSLSLSMIDFKNLFYFNSVIYFNYLSLNYLTNAIFEINLDTVLTIPIELMLCALTNQSGNLLLAKTNKKKKINSIRT